MHTSKLTWHCTSSNNIDKQQAYALNWCCFEGEYEPPVVLYRLYSTVSWCRLPHSSCDRLWVGAWQLAKLSSVSLLSLAALPQRCSVEFIVQDLIFILATDRPYHPLSNNNTGVASRLTDNYLFLRIIVCMLVYKKYTTPTVSVSRLILKR